VRSDRFLEPLHSGEQWEIQKIISSFSDRSTGKGWWTSRTGAPGTGGEKVMRNIFSILMCLVLCEMGTFTGIILHSSSVSFYERRKSGIFVGRKTFPNFSSASCQRRSGTTANPTFR
jgi:hypothetical protein